MMSAEHITTTAMLQLVSFVIDKEEYGIDILNVQEIIRSVEISRVPNAPEFVDGVINLRGKIVPVLDLRKRFGKPARPKDKDTRIIVIELGDKVVGFIVDKMKEVIRIPQSIIEAPPELSLDVNTKYITGIAKLEDRILVLLDLVQLLDGNEQVQLKEFDAAT
jgi:purine-binding chemotaxis protein CheW